LRFALPSDALCVFFSKTTSLTELKIGLTQFGSDIDEVQVASIALEPTKRCNVSRFGRWPTQSFWNAFLPPWVLMYAWRS
jgi:hypothetical protein